MGRSPRQQRTVIATAAAMRFASGILMGTAMAVVVGRRGSPFAVSLVLTAYFVGLLFFSPLWGAIADVTGRRKPILVGTSLVATLAILPLSVVDGVWTQIGLRGVYTVFAAGFSPIMLTIVSERGGEEGRGRALGFYNSSRALGTTGGQVGAGALLGLLVPVSIYLVIAGVAFVTTVAATLVNDPSRTPNRPSSAARIGAELRSRVLPAADERAYLETNDLEWLYVAIAVRNTTVLGVTSLMPIYLTDTVGVSEYVMGILLAIDPGTQTVAMYGFGRLADLTSRTLLIAAGMVGNGLFALIAAGATIPGPLRLSGAVVGIGFVVLATSFSAMRTGATAFIGDVASGGHQSDLMGLLSTAKGTGGLVGPPLLGAVATATSFRIAFAGGSVLAFVAAALAAVMLVEP